MVDDMRSPFGQLLGIKVLSRTAEATVAELVVRPDLCNHRGVLHGGAIMSLGDAMGGMASKALLTAEQFSVTIESKTNFFAPLRVGETVRAVCKALHAGRTTQVLETSIIGEGDRLAAKVTQTQLVVSAAAKKTRTG